MAKNGNVVHVLSTKGVIIAAGFMKDEKDGELAIDDPAEGSARIKVPKQSDLFGKWVDTSKRVNKVPKGCSG
jgi:hypothetical protein